MLCLAAAHVIFEVVGGDPVSVEGQQLIHGLRAAQQPAGLLVVLLLQEVAQDTAQLVPPAPRRPVPGNGVDGSTAASHRAVLLLGAHARTPGRTGRPCVLSCNRDWKDILLPRIGAYLCL